jgi:hypothetical protein
MPLWDNVEKYRIARQVADDSAVFGKVMQCNELVQ